MAAQGIQDATPNNVMDSPEKLLGEEFPFEEHLFDEPRRTKLHMSRSETREHNLKWAEGLNTFNSTQLKTEQEKDPDIQKWIQKEDPTRIVRKQGVICWVWNPRDSPETRYEQIILPKQYRSKVLELAHDIPLSGHLGKEKTA